MEVILKALAIYVFILIVSRLLNKRSIADLTPFDFISLIIIAVSAQRAIMGNDNSWITGVIIISSFIVLDILFFVLRSKNNKLKDFFERRPIVIVENGRPIQDRLETFNITEADILASARRLQGIEKIEEIKYAVLEKTGEITIVKKAG